MSKWFRDDEVNENLIDCICVQSSPLQSSLLVTVNNSSEEVSTGNVSLQTLVPEIQQSFSPSNKHWYALRATYGREFKAFDYITSHGGEAYLPTMTTEKIIKEKITKVKISRLPNIFFAHGTEDSIKSFVYDNVNLPFLRFYYKHNHVKGGISKEPLIVPDTQIESFRIICEQNEASDTLFFPEEVSKFLSGEKVRVMQGPFAGVVGVVARFQGQQRVGVVMDGLMTAITAYVPSAFLEKLG